jgi:hypothetical protein
MVSNLPSVRCAVRRRNISSKGNVVDNIIAASIRIQPATMSNAAKASPPPGSARQRLPATPASVHLP